MKFLFTLEDPKQLLTELNTFQKQNSEFVKAYNTPEVALFTIGIIEQSFEKEYPDYCKNIVNGKSADNKIYGGNYLLILIARNNEIMVINDPLGMLPLYFGTFKGKSIVSNSLSLIQTNFPDALTINRSAIWQNILFNYPVSNETFYKEMNFLPAATVLTFRNHEFSSSGYWDAAQLMNREEVKSGKGIDLIHDSLSECISTVSGLKKKMAVSFTGGWDGRLVLSYLLANKTESYLTYSFGSEDFTDVTIPKKIAKKLGIPYEHITLDKNYIREHYIKYAERTILNSDGVRPANRAHYCYAVDKLEPLAKIILSGNGGSNLLKNIHSTCPLYNENITTLFRSKSAEEAVRKIINDLRLKTPLLTITADDQQQLTESLQQSMAFERIPGLTVNQNFYRFIIMHIERMYFGIEGNSYLSQIFNYSPFLDLRFINAVSRTGYFPGRFAFFSGDIHQFFMQGKLYHELIRRNSPLLATSVTDRGYPLSYYNSGIGRLMIYQIKFLKKYIYNRKNAGDGFATISGNRVFVEKVLPLAETSKNNFFLGKDISAGEILNNQMYLNAVSMLSWVNMRQNSLAGNETE